MDDPCTVWRGTPAARSRNKVILLWWWLVVGPAISWKKQQIGRQVKWIGDLVQLEEKAVVITLPDKCIDGDAGGCQAGYKMAAAVGYQAKDSGSFVGRADWAASVGALPQAQVVRLEGAG